MTNAHPRATEHIAYAQRERLAFIEVRSYFCGNLTRVHIEERFGVKPAASARDLIAYRALAPNNLQYNAALRCYQPTAAFRPVFEHTPAHVLNWFRSGAGDGLEGASVQAIPCEAAQDLVQPNLSMLATITRAITAGTVIEVSYLSLTSGASIKRLAPLALADTGFRWHLRAYDQAKNRFADFVLTRIESARSTQETIPEPQRLPHDAQWNRMVPLDLVTHPGINHPAAIEADYGMTDGNLALSIRAPLVGYALKRWSVDCTADHCLSPNRTTCGCATRGCSMGWKAPSLRQVSLLHQTPQRPKPDPCLTPKSQPDPCCCPRAAAWRACFARSLRLKPGMLRCMKTTSCKRNQPQPSVRPR